MWRLHHLPLGRATATAPAHRRREKGGHAAAFLAGRVGSRWCTWEAGDEGGGGKGFLVGGPLVTRAGWRGDERADAALLVDVRKRIKLIL
jgi:hypothetical protein